MRFIFKFPDIGEGISEGKILEWYVKKGQQIKSGENLVKMETDKVVADIPSPKSGVIVATFGVPGDLIQVEDPLVELEIAGINGEQAQKLAKEIPKKTAPQSSGEKGFGVVGTLEVAGDGAFLPASEEGRTRQKATKNKTQKVLATPVARAFARELNIDINKVHGSGPAGRVMKKDILAYSQKCLNDDVQAEPKISSANVEIEQMSQIRKAIARRMTLAKQTAPHMTLHEQVDVSELVCLRNAQKQKFAERDVKLTYLPFIIKAVTTALQKYKSLNSQIDMEKGQIIYKHYYHLGIAVDAPDGLVVPVLRNADRLSIYELSVALLDIVARARERRLSLDDMKDGTFSITNYGAMAGIHAVPIINYPEVAILGIGRIHQAPVVRDGQLQIGTILPLSISVDHRVVDGGEVSRFIKEIMDRLADPVSLLLG